MAALALDERRVSPDHPSVARDDEYLAFRSAVLDPLRLSQGLRIRSYDASLVVEAMATSARMLAPDQELPA
ncbi:MAG: hypothetical protein J2O38_00425 [Acidimicrobiales bacterium]|nr:hypothetical protein [Acidimicrobiales bacterium]